MPVRRAKVLKLGLGYCLRFPMALVQQSFSLSFTKKATTSQGRTLLMLVRLLWKRKFYHNVTKTYRLQWFKDLLWSSPDELVPVYQNYPVLFQNYHYPMLSSNEQKSLGQVPSKAHYHRNCHLEYHYCLYHKHFLHYYAIIIFIVSTLLKKLEINKIHYTWKYQLILHLRTRFNVELRNTSFQ